MKKYRLIAMIRTRNESWILETWLKRTSEFVDGIVALDDRSTDDSVKILESHPKVLQVVQKKTSAEFWTEHQDRNTILDVARSYNPEWVFVIDPDEIMDARLANCLDSLLKQSDVGRHTFREVTLWGSPEQVRIDHPEKYARQGIGPNGIVRMSPALRWVKRTEFTWRHRVIRLIRERRWQHVPNVGSEKLIGIQGRELTHPDIVKIHYHFADLERAWRVEMRYTLYWAIAMHISLHEVESVVDKIAHRFSFEGLELAPVDPAWGTLLLPPKKSLW